MGEEGFFFTPITGRQNVAFNSGWVTWAFLNRSAIGRMNLSYFGGFRVKLSGTKQTLVHILFQAFFFLFPVVTTRKTSASLCARTFGYIPLASFFLSFLLYHVRQNFSSTLALTVEQVGRNSSIRCLLVIFLLSVPLVMHL
uniref:Uncharacterized protein n=1 Tax=Ciona intestinalis TaxID=7719 RepID=H2XW23_CIOIN